MKYVLLIYVFTSVGEYMWKEVIPTESLVQCESTASTYTKTLINTKNMASYFCISEKEYVNEIYRGYEDTLNPMDEHEEEKES